MTSTITTANLRTLLAAAIPFTAGSDGYPVLNAIRLEAGGGIACTTATDRYALGHVRKQATGSLEPAYLDRGDAQRLVDWLDHHIAVGHPDDLAELELDGGDLFVTVATVAEAFPSQNVGVWPDLRTVLDGSPRGEAGTAPVGISSTNLTKLLNAVTALVSPRDPMRWYVGDPTSAIRIEVDDCFVALLMPVNSRSRDGVDMADMPRVPYGLPVAGAVSA